MVEPKAKPFHFKQFSIEQDQCPMKVGTDGVLLGAWADVHGAKNALDIGTGTGLIAIMLGQRTEDMTISAVEIDQKACTQAQANMAKVSWSDRLEAIHIPIQEFVNTTNQEFDLLVSNPPFFTGGTFSGKEDRNSVRHTVKLPHGDLLRAVRALLAPDGKFALILPYIEGLRFIELANTYNLHLTKKMEVYPKANKGIERLLLQFERNAKPIVEERLVIQRESRNDWTEDYVALTGDFYLRM